jgi:hypothetical protein
MKKGASLLANMTHLWSSSGLYHKKYVHRCRVISVLLKDKTLIELENGEQKIVSRFSLDEILEPKKKKAMRKQK